MPNEVPLSKHRQFLRDSFGGANWVLAKRTANIVRRYGESVICVSKQRYAAVEREYRALYGDPNDKTRAELYCALKEVCRLHAKPTFQGNPFTYSPEWQRALAAIDSEANA
jgi:hypothetical protein